MQGVVFSAFEFPILHVQNITQYANSNRAETPRGGGGLRGETPPISRKLVSSGKE